MIEDLIYDVGVHRGEDSAYYLAKGYRVRAFEANPDLVAGCRTRFADDDDFTLLAGWYDTHATRGYLDRSPDDR